MKNTLSPRAALSRVAVIALTGGLLAAAPIPALAAPRTGPTVTIAASSQFPEVSGDTFVFFFNGKANFAQLKGTSSESGTPTVLEVFAQQFPYNKPPVEVGNPVTTKAHYKFFVQPKLATRYKVELFATDTATTPLAISPTVTVYLVAPTRLIFRKCGRPVCHETVTLLASVPASTLKTERAKAWFEYFGLTLRRTRAPRPPTTLHLGAGSPHFGKPAKISAFDYEVKLKLTFTVNNDGYDFAVVPCQRDTEAKDGLNLPGHHGCGTQKIVTSHTRYLG